VLASLPAVRQAGATSSRICPLARELARRTLCGPLRWRAGPPDRTPRAGFVLYTVEPPHRDGCSPSTASQLPAHRRPAPMNLRPLEFCAPRACPPLIIARQYLAPFPLHPSFPLCSVMFLRRSPASPRAREICAGRIASRFTPHAQGQYLRVHPRLTLVQWRRPAQWLDMQTASFPCHQLADFTQMCLRFREGPTDLTPARRVAAPLCHRCSSAATHLPPRLNSRDNPNGHNPPCDYY